jgi:nitrate/nitrite transporter NarK
VALETTSRPASNALIVLIAVALVNYIDRSLLSILQVGIKKDLGLSDTQLGALTGLAFGLFYSTVRIPAHGGRDFQVNVDIDSSATWTELRRDHGQFAG